MSSDNLDQLERLARLRETGALSDSEFEDQKQLILAGKKVSRVPRAALWGGTAIIAAVGVASLAFFSDRDGGPTDASASALPLVESPLALSSEPPAPTAVLTPEAVSTISASDQLNFATSDQVIGINPAYLEQRLGVPKEKSTGHLVFDLGGCTIYYWASGSRITGFTVDVGPSCSPTIRGNRIGPRTTFGEILNRENWGQLTADCIYSCGNAADPVIDLTYRGSRSTNFISIRYSTSHDQAYEALDLWEQEVRGELGLGEYESPPDFEPFNCVSNPPANARRLMPRMKVRSISVSGDQSGPCT